MSTETTAFGQVQPPAAERARRWSALSATVREKYERLEAEARQVEGASSATREALEAARRAHRRAEERLREATDPYLLPKSRPAAAAIADMQAEVAHLHDRCAVLERQREEGQARTNATLRLLAACRKHLGLAEGSL